jgi:hypothetical protein
LLKYLFINPELTISVDDVPKWEIAMIFGKDILLSAWAGLAAFSVLYGSILLIRAFT